MTHSFLVTKGPSFSATRVFIATAFLSTILLISACNVSREDTASTETCGLQTDEIGTFFQFDGGSYVKGQQAVYPEERPELRLSVAPFEMQIHEVTNAQFERFVADTGYVTLAERTDPSRDEPYGSAVFEQASAETGRPNQWHFQSDASWRHPRGNGSSIDLAANHPVVNVALEDAMAYATWAGGRLPNEVEWEFAAQSGLIDPSIPTSNAYREGQPVANTWQGVFPVMNTVKDGYRNSAPAGCFPADANGLYDLIGNVWEWTETPYGPGTATIKGGSFLCADNFCQRYRPAARQGHETNFSSNHIGFRIVRDVEPAKADPS